MSMSSHVLGSELTCSVSNASLLVVGAGGIGCELLKNLVLTGFSKIHIIDLDTIDVSNLNRQFLFQKQHVSKSKALTAKESVLRFKPDAEIIAAHDTIMNPEYNADFFASFDLVMNALDNKAARNHVNRLCLAAKVPLVESGSAGYLGQVTVIKKGETECYECQPKPAQKTFPGCTIRNTPSEPVHCIVWAKHLFNQLFGEFDADNEVSPDTADPELGGEVGQKSADQKSNGETVATERVSTRQWAKDIDYNPTQLFNKFFESDIRYLLSMEKLWQKRRAPGPLSFAGALEQTSQEHQSSGGCGLADKRIWSIHECAKVFEKCIQILKERSSLFDEPLDWDKDDEAGMDFVAAAANIRASIFHIPVQSRFDIKSISGNIIPAIATTNAIIGGLMVMEALKILSNQFNKCRTIYLNKTVKTKNRLLNAVQLDRPNPKCYVCAEKPEVTVYMDVTTVTCKVLEDRLFKEKLGMISPDVEIDDGKGSIIISSEEGETEQNWHKTLKEFNITSGMRLKADDFLQNYELTAIVRHKTDIPPPDLFLLEGELPKVAAPEEEKPAAIAEASSAMAMEINEDGTSSAQETSITETPGKKRKISDSVSESASKKRKSETPIAVINGNHASSAKNVMCGDDEVIIL